MTAGIWVSLAITWAAGMLWLYLRHKEKTEGSELPEILLSTSGDTAEASGSTEDGISWNIYAEAEDGDNARCWIKIDSELIAHITVHADNKNLADETSDICAALIWSAIRACRLRRKAKKTT